MRQASGPACRACAQNNLCLPVREHISTDVVLAFSGGFVPEQSQTARALLLVSMLARAGLVGARVQEELKDMVLACERFPFALLGKFEAQPTLYPLLEPLREGFGDRLEEPMRTAEPGGDAAATEQQKETTNSVQFERMVWECAGGVLCGFTADFQACERVTAVLLDSLVVTKSGRAEPVSALDWRWRIDNAVCLLKKRVQGTSLVIVAVPPSAASAYAPLAPNCLRPSLHPCLPLQLYNSRQE